MSKSMKIKDLLKHTEFTVAGEYDWDGLREEFLPASIDIPKAEAVLATIHESLLQGGYPIEDYRFFVSVVIANESDADVLGYVTLDAKLNGIASVAKPSVPSQFVFPLLEADLDGQVEMDVTKYETLQPSAQDGSYTNTTSREPLFMGGVKQLKTQKREERQAVHPIFGWVKEVMRKNIFSYADLVDVIKPAFYEEEKYGHFIANLNAQLVGEFPILDLEHPLFNLKFNNSEATQYATLSIVYHSQRANAHPKHNVLHALSDLQWGDNADFPLIDSASTTFQPISYTGDFLENAGMLKRFEFHRADSKVGPEMALIDQLDTYLHDKALATLLESRLVKSGIHHLVKRVTVKLVDSDTSHQALVCFFALGLDAHALAYIYIPMIFDNVHLSYSHELAELIVDADAVRTALKHEGSKIAQPETMPLKFDLGVGLQAMADQPAEPSESKATESETAWAAKARAMPAYEKKEAASVVVNSRSFDLNFEMEFTDPVVAMPVLYPFEQKLPGIGDKYRELCAMLSERARLTGSEPVVFTAVGHVGDHHEANTTMLELTLTHEQTVNGNSIRTQVNAVLVA